MGGPRGPKTSKKGPKSGQKASRRSPRRDQSRGAESDTFFHHFFRDVAANLETANLAFDSVFTDPNACRPFPRMIV